MAVSYIQGRMKTFLPFQRVRRVIATVFFI